MKKVIIILFVSLLVSCDIEDSELSESCFPTISIVLEKDTISTDDKIKGKVSLQNIGSIELVMHDIVPYIVVNDSILKVKNDFTASFEFSPTISVSSNKEWSQGKLDCSIMIPNPNIGHGEVMLIKSVNYWIVNK